MISNQKGFTLLEITVSVGISTIVAYAIFLGMQTGDAQKQTSDITMEIQDSAREGLYQMEQEIRLSASSKVTLGGGGTSIQFSIPDSTNPTNADYTVNWTAAHLIQYALGGTSGRQIIRTDLTAGGTKVLANDVTSLIFTGNATPPTVVTIAMNVQRALINGRNIPATAFQMTAKAELRNT